MNQTASPHGVRYYVSCRVEPGMFSGEYLVSLDAVDPDDPNQTVSVQLFADAHEIDRIQGSPLRGLPVPARLRVERDEDYKGFPAIILPQPAEPFGVRVLVAEDQLEEVLT